MWFKKNKMKNYTSVKDIFNLEEAVKTAFEVKKNPFGFQHLGKNKTMVLVFFNSSLRTRLSTQRCIRLDTPMILRSESAATAIAAKML